MKYTKEKLEQAAKESLSVREVMRRIGANPSSNSLATHLSKQMKKFGIDTTHFTGKAHLKGGSSWNKLLAQEVLVRRSEGSEREKSYILRRALLEIGREFVCEICKINEWMGKPLGLEVDHKDGNRLNNEPSNLRFLCPNCHSQETPVRKLPMAQVVPSAKLEMKVIRA
jgi:Zn finger protein HypA/HybF involved in hydrogenase expression